MSPRDLFSVTHAICPYAKSIGSDRVSGIHSGFQCYELCMMGAVRPLIRLNHFQSHGFELSQEYNVYGDQKYDPVRRALGIWWERPLSADTHSPFSEFVWGQPHYDPWRAVASYSLTYVSSNIFESPCRLPRRSRASCFPIIILAMRYIY